MTDRMSAAEYRLRHGQSNSATENLGNRMSADDLKRLLSSGAVTSKTLGVRTKIDATAPNDRKSVESKITAPIASADAVEPARKRKPYNNFEFDEQCQLFGWAREPLVVAKHPELRLLSSSLNGVKLTKAQAGKAKAAGMLRGESDVRLPVARGRYIGLVIEMKYGNNSVTSEQAEYGALMEAEGHRFEVCYSCAAAQDVILDYLSQARPRLIGS